MALENGSPGGKKFQIFIPVGESYGFVQNNNNCRYFLKLGPLNKYLMLINKLTLKLNIN